MARRNGSTKFNARKAQGHVKSKAARMKIELRSAFDVEALKADGYKVVGFDKED